MPTDETLLGGDRYNVVYEQSTPEVYDAWAKDGYDEMIASNSLAVTSVCTVMERMLDGGPAVLLDAGCGTGRLAEVCHSTLGNSVPLTIDGLDYSKGMLQVAQEKKLYQKLLQADLTKPLSDLADGAYTGVISSGTFLQGHVGPEALPELCRITRPGGFMAFSVRPTFFEEKRDEWMSALEAGGMFDINIEMLPYSRGNSDANSPMLAPFVSCRKGSGAQ